MNARNTSLTKPEQLYKPEKRKKRDPFHLKPYLYSGTLFLCQIQCKIDTQMRKRREKAGMLLLFGRKWRRG
jgi:hypothetical protein